MEYINNQIYKNYIKKQYGGKYTDTTNALKYLANLHKKLKTEEKNLEIILKDHSPLTESQLKTLKDQVMNFKLDIDIFSTDLSEYKRSIENIDYENEVRKNLEQIDGIAFGDIKDGEKIDIPITTIDLSIYLRRLKREVENFLKILSDKLSFSRFDDISLENINKEIEKFDSLKLILKTKLEQVKKIKVENTFVLQIELFHDKNFLKSLSTTAPPKRNIAKLDSRLKSLVDNELKEKYSEQEIKNMLPNDKYKKFAQDLINSGELLESFEFQKEIFEDINKIDKLLLIVKPTKNNNYIEFIPKSFLELLMTDYGGQKINIFQLKDILEERSLLIDIEISKIKSELEPLKSKINPIMDAINKFLLEKNSSYPWSLYTYANLSATAQFDLLNTYIRKELLTAIKALEENKDIDDATYLKKIKDENALFKITDISDDTFFKAIKDENGKTKITGILQDILEKNTQPWTNRTEIKKVFLDKKGIYKIVLNLYKEKKKTNVASIQEQVSKLNNRLKELELDKQKITSKKSENEMKIEKFMKERSKFPWIQEEQVGGINKDMIDISNKRFLLLNEIFLISLNIKTELYKKEVQVKKIQDQYDLINFIKFIIILIFRYNYKYGTNKINTQISSEEIKELIENINKITSNLGSQDASVSNFLNKYILILNLTLEICNKILNLFEKNYRVNDIIYINYKILNPQNKIFMDYLTIIYELIKNLSNLIVI